MPLRSMYSGISGMRAEQSKLDVIANNIANESTTGFKSSRATFSDMLYQNASEASAPSATKGGTNAKQVGLGSKLASIDKVMGQGNAISTGRSLDVCMDGDGYFVVASGPVDGNVVVTQASHSINPTGTNEDVLFTRDGNFTLDQDGNLLTSDGYRVMGYDLGALDYTTNAGKNILAATTPVLADTLAKGDATGLRPLAIPDYVGKDPVNQFSIGRDGLITAVLGSGTRVVLGQIAKASFKNPEGLTEQGGNMLNVSSNSGPASISARTNLTTTADDNSKAYGDCVQGCLEGSNVDLTEQFTEMIQATRSFQASSKMISNGDEILQTITGLIR